MDRSQPESRHPPMSGSGRVSVETTSSSSAVYASTASYPWPVSVPGTTSNPGSEMSPTGHRVFNYGSPKACVERRNNGTDLAAAQGFLLHLTPCGYPC